MNYKLILFPFLFFLQFITAQTAMPKNEVSHKLANTGDDRERVNLLLDLSYLYAIKSNSTAIDIDSAYNVMLQARKLSTRINYPQGIIKSELIESLIALNKKDKKKSFSLASHALSVYQKKNDYNGQGEAYILLGLQYENEGISLEKKTVYFKKAAEFFAKGKNPLREAITLKDIADFLKMNNKYEESLPYLQKSLKLYKGAGSKDLQGIYVLLSAYYSNSGDLSKALEYALMAAKAAEICGDTTAQLSQINNQIGMVYFAMYNFTEAIKYFDKALDLSYKHNDKDGVNVAIINKINCLNSCDRFNEAIPLLKMAYPNALGNGRETAIHIEEVYTYIYFRLGKIKEGLPHLKKWEKLSVHSIDPSNKIIILSAKYKYYLALRQYDKCYKYLTEFREAIIDQADKTYMAKLESYYFVVDSSCSRYQSAIGHYQKNKFLEDSLFNANNQKVSQIEIQYETDRKNREIQLKKNNLSFLNNETALQKSEIENYRLIFIATISGSLALLLLSGISYKGFCQKRQNNKILRQQRNEIDNQNILLNQLVSTQNELIIEKEWLLSEVHDRVKNNLETIMNLLSAQLDFLGDRAAQVAVLDSSHRIRAMSLIHQKLQDIKDTKNIYMPDYITELVDHLIDSYNSKNLIHTKFSIDPITLEVAKAVPLGLILNELVTNAIKYAFIKNKENASISVSLSQTGKNEIIFVVSDNGNGFPEDFNTEQTASFGIILIKGLTDDLDGEFKIENKDGAQFTIIFKNEYPEYTEKHQYKYL